MSLPKFGNHRVIAAYPNHTIKGMQQPGKGKADAVVTVDAGTSDVLMIFEKQISRFRHRLMLLCMVLFAFRHIKAL